MKKIYILFAILLIPLQSFSQIEMQSTRSEGIPEFFYDLVNVASNKPGLSRLNLFIEIPYDELQFIKQDKVYKASYEVSVVIFDKDGEQVDGKIWQEQVVVSNYDLTNSRRYFSLTHNKFHLKPNKYKISIGLMDMDTKKTGFRKSVFLLRDFSKDKLSISDITFTDDTVTDSLGVKSIHPQVADCIRSMGTKLYCYFEIYSNIPDEDTFDISYKLKNHKEEVIASREYKRKKDAYRTMEFFELDKKNLQHGKYLLELKVKQGKYSDEVKKVFIVRWRGMPTSIADLSTAIEQLKYIANSSELKKIKNAPKDEQLTRFKEFWKKHDPSPGTEVNELMDEYYRRVEYANENFSTFREGWKNDMGMIYIIFGAPSDIERHPFDRGYKPYEIWYYYNINRQFIFMDESGFGEYRLRTPLWRDWRSSGKIYF